MTGARRLRTMVRAAQREQAQLCADIPGAKKKRGQKVAVNRLFVKRLKVILSICVPSAFCKETALIGIQGLLLYSRTLLTDYISKLEGFSGSALISQDFQNFGRGVLGFALVGVPAAVVNSGLKYFQKRIELAFQERLTLALHKTYCSNRSYYAASTLQGLTNADQRITEDVEKFAFSISELYSHTFKPLLDVILFTRSLARVMGYKGQVGLYLYYIIAAYILKALSPPLSQMFAQEAALSGSLRAAHQRLVMNSEEVAFNDPPAGAAEQLILNQHLRRLVKYSGLSSFQRFLQQIADGYFVKYFASAVALVVYGAPIYLKSPKERGTHAELAEDYIRCMRLLQNTSRGIGDLILVYKRIAGLASHTSRVAELLEQVKQLSADDSEHKELFRKNLSHGLLLGVQNSEGMELVPPQRFQGDVIKFHRVALDAPDGTALVRELNFEVKPGQSVMLMGPNGCGKSSLFRVLAGLWPLMSGEITSPDKSHLFYLAQRPYLVAGSLRDQLLYPLPPKAVWKSATENERRQFASISGRDVSAIDSSNDRMRECLDLVELEYLLERGKGWDQVQNWTETLSGGEKQRLAMARLLYHKPDYAILDECTSAVSADGEMKLYEACIHSGITFLSIAHRPALKRFHQMVIHIDGIVQKTGIGWRSEKVNESSGNVQDASANGPARHPILTS